MGRSDMGARSFRLETTLAAAVLVFALGGYAVCRYGWGSLDPVRLAVQVLAAGAVLLIARLVQWRLGRRAGRRIEVGTPIAIYVGVLLVVVAAAIENLSEGDAAMYGVLAAPFLVSAFRLYRLSSGGAGRGGDPVG